MAIVPNREAFMALAAADDDGPVVMLNLLKFKSGGGSKEYGQYGSTVSGMVEERGGRILWQGRVAQALIGDEDWDAIALVQYPSRKAFIDMVTSKDYDGAHEHREAGLERTVLLACEERR
jgi:uncharacterized protein (DUF1330 family)